MRIFITIEAQNCTENGLAEIMRTVDKELSFVTDEKLEHIDNYGTEFQEIAIIPTCVDDNFWEILGWKERKQIWRKKKEADIRLRMDYYKFMKESYENKRLMFIDIIIKSIQVVQEKSKGDFKGDELIKDIMKAVNVTQEQLDYLNNKSYKI